MPPRSSLSALLLSVAVLIAGNGILNALLPMRGKLEGFSDVAIGLLGSAYFAGMLAGTLAAPALIARCGFVRAFVVLAASAVVIALAFPVAGTPAAWVGLRYAIGFVFSGFYAVIEAWLSLRSDDTNRGRSYALYQMCTFAGTAAGQQILAWIDPRSDILFSIAAGAFALAVLPLALSRAEPSAPPRTLRPRFGWLVRTLPTAVFAAFCVGAANGGFWSLAPVFGIGIGLSPARAATFLTAVIVGTAVSLYPVGRLSDGHDRRTLLAWFALAGAAIECALVVAGTLPFPVVAALGVALGASTMVLYMLAISHANDRAPPHHAVAVSSGLLFAYCAGAIVAPLVASCLMAWWGAGALFAQNAAIHLTLAAVATAARFRLFGAISPPSPPLNSRARRTA